MRQHSRSTPQTKSHRVRPWLATTALLLALAVPAFASKAPYVTRVIERPWTQRASRNFQVTTAGADSEARAIDFALERALETREKTPSVPGWRRFEVFVLDDGALLDSIATRALSAPGGFLFEWSLRYALIVDARPEAAAAARAALEANRAAPGDWGTLVSVARVALDGPAPSADSAVGASRSVPGSRVAAELGLALVFPQLGPAAVGMELMVAAVQSDTAIARELEGRDRLIVMARLKLSEPGAPPRLRCVLANMLYDESRWEDAREEYERVLDVDPGNVSAMVDLATCFFSLDDSERARKWLEKALARDPNHQVAIFNRGVLHESQGEFDAALADYARALELNSGDVLRENIDAVIERASAAKAKAAVSGALGGKR